MAEGLIPTITLVLSLTTGQPLHMPGFLSPDDCMDSGDAAAEALEQVADWQCEDGPKRRPEG